MHYRAAVARRLSQDWSRTVCTMRDRELGDAEHLAACTMAGVVDPRRYLETLYGARRLATPEAPSDAFTRKLKALRAARARGEQMYTPEEVAEAHRLLEAFAPLREAANRRHLGGTDEP